jgi:gephyrin
MAQQMLAAAILVVSETASRDPSSDASIPMLQEVFSAEGEGKWTVTEVKIIPDDLTQIQRQIVQWTEAIESPNLILTTGGTGFAAADHTPEVCLTLEPLPMLKYPKIPMLWPALCSHCS